MGPGPSNVAPSVLKAMSDPVLGHLDPVFVQMMEEIKAMLRAVFQTKSEMTFPVSGTGSAGMEFCLVNLNRRVPRGDFSVFAREFEVILQSAGIQAVRLPPRSPILKAQAKGFVCCIEECCLARAAFPFV